MPDILSGKHAQHILEVVVLEHIIGWHLQIRDEFAHVFRASFDHLSYHLCFIFEIRYELFKILYFYVPSGHRIVALPNKLELSNHVFEYFDAFLLIRVGESVQNDCHEQIEEDDADYQLKQDEVEIGYWRSASVGLASVRLDALVSRVFVTVEVDRTLSHSVFHHFVPTLSCL
jgi:hypothetical protein